MINTTEFKRGFTQLSRAWYADANLRGSDKVEEITIGFYHTEGGTAGEFQIRWEPLCKKVTPRLLAFDDGWEALFLCSDLLKFMASVDGEDISPEDMRSALVALGIEDMTRGTQEG